MRERKSKRNLKLPDDSNVAVLKQQISKLVDENNSVQKEIDFKKSQLAKIKTEIESTVAALQLIQDKILKQEERGIAEQHRLANNLKIMKDEADKEIVLSYSLLSLKEKEFNQLCSKLQQEIIGREKIIEEAKAEISKKENHVKNRLYELELNEKSYESIRNIALQERQTTKIAKEDLQAERLEVENKRKELQDVILGIEEMRNKHYQNVLRLEQDRKDFEYEKKDILGKVSGFEAREEANAKKEKAMDAQKSGLAIREKMLEIERMDINKLKKDLSKIEKRVLNV
jgi:hypothetical protein